MSILSRMRGMFPFGKKKEQVNNAYISNADRSKPYAIEVEKSDICRAILDCNATRFAKGQVLHVRKDSGNRIVEIKRNSAYTKLFIKPNPFMSSFDLLYALSWQLDLSNYAIGYIDWDLDTLQPRGVYPIVASNGFTVVLLSDNSYGIKFRSDLDLEEHVVRVSDVFMLRKQYKGIGLVTADNMVVQDTLSIQASIDESIVDSSDTTNRVHGLLKLKKAMISDDDAKKAQEDFINRIQNASKNGGIVVLDSMEDFHPLTLNQWSADADQMNSVQRRLYTYFRTPQSVVDGTANEQTIQNYYDGLIEPRWMQMGQALTQLLFTKKEQDFGNQMIVAGGEAYGASWQTKLKILDSTVQTGELTVNERRELLGYSPVEGGDERLTSLNYTHADKLDKYQGTGDDNNEE